MVFKMPGDRVKRIFFFWAGIAAIAGACWIIMGRIDVLRHYSAAAGVVIEMQKEFDSGGRARYHPFIKFKTAKNEEITFVSYSPGKYAAGTEVEVLYEPDKPKATAVLNSFSALWGLPLVMMFAGIGGVCIGFERRRSA
jgi:hypothetical protein